MKQKFFGILSQLLLGLQLLTEIYEVGTRILSIENRDKTIILDLLWVHGLKTFLIRSLLSTQLSRLI